MNGVPFRKRETRASTLPVASATLRAICCFVPPSATHPYCREINPVALAALTRPALRRLAPASFVSFASCTSSASSFASFFVAPSAQNDPSLAVEPNTTQLIENKEERYASLDTPLRFIDTQILESEGSLPNPSTAYRGFLGGTSSRQ